MEGNPFVNLRTRVALKGVLAGVGATYYEQLGVSPGACDEVSLKTAHRECVGMFHPDRNPEFDRAHDFTAKLNVAYETLSDATRRRTYDATLRSTHAECPVCAGAGFKVKQRGFKGTDRLRCLGCGGAGWVRK